MYSFRLFAALAAAFIAASAIAGQPAPLPYQIQPDPACADATCTKQFKFQKDETAPTKRGPLGCVVQATVIESRTMYECMTSTGRVGSIVDNPRVAYAVCATRCEAFEEMQPETTDDSGVEFDECFVVNDYGNKVLCN